MNVINSFSSVEEIILIGLKASKNEKFIILGVYLVTRATDSGMDVDLGILLEMQRLINALIVRATLNFHNQVHVFRLVPEPKQLMSDFVPDRPLLRPVQVKFIFHKTVTIVDEH